MATLRAALRPLAHMPFVDTWWLCCTRAFVEWNLRRVIVQTFFEWISSSSSILTRDIPALFGFVTSFAQLPIGREESQAFTWSQVTASFFFHLLFGIAFVFG